MKSNLYRVAYGETIMDNKKVIFFDLFHTLIHPDYSSEKNENDILEMTPDEWESYAESKELYSKRATCYMSPEEIINDIVNIIPKEINEFQKEEILKLRLSRMKNALTNVDPKILETLKALKQMGIKLCLISNADTIDVMYWNDSILSTYFDNVIFSYEIGYLKPEPQIYKVALDVMCTTPNQSFFIGDGGSDELKGAKGLGISTIFTEYLQKKDDIHYRKIILYADYHISDFTEVLEII